MKIVNALACAALIGGSGTVLAQATPQAPANAYPLGLPPEMQAHQDPSLSGLATATQNAGQNANARRAARQGSTARAANAADLAPGSQVFDSSGTLLGHVDHLDGVSAIVATGAGKVAVPAEAFGKNKQGLLLDVSKQQFDGLVASAAGK